MSPATRIKALYKVLTRLAADGVLLRGDAARGRRAHFVAVATPSPSPGSSYTSAKFPDPGLPS